MNANLQGKHHTSISVPSLNPSLDMSYEVSTLLKDLKAHALEDNLVDAHDQVLHYAIEACPFLNKANRHERASLPDYELLIIEAVAALQCQGVNLSASLWGAGTVQQHCE